jgi:hypothetical protein
MPCNPHELQVGWRGVRKMTEKYFDNESVDVEHRSVAVFERNICLESLGMEVRMKFS